MLSLVTSYVKFWTGPYLYKTEREGLFFFFFFFVKSLCSLYSSYLDDILYHHYISYYYIVVLNKIYVKLVFNSKEFGLRS